MRDKGTHSSRRLQVEVVESKKMNVMLVLKFKSINIKNTQTIYSFDSTTYNTEAKVRKKEHIYSEVLV